MTDTLGDRAALLGVVQRGAKALSEFRTPSTQEPVDPSHVNVVLRFLRTRPSIADIDAFLSLLPRSAAAEYTHSAEPQVRRVCEVTRTLLAGVQKLSPGKDDATVATRLAYVLGWTARLLRTGERRREGGFGGDRHGPHGPPRR